jgi:hypothetical protein
MENEINIYLDMDGVLVNWDKGYKEYFVQEYPDYKERFAIDSDIEKISPWKVEEEYLFKHFLKKYTFNYKKAKSASKGAFWKPVQGKLEFWTGLDWTDDGKELLSYLVNLKNEKKINTLNILSSPSSDKVCEVGKRQWLKNHNVYDLFDSVIIQSDKSKYAAGNKHNILIDDTPKKVDGFKFSGGTAILHKTTKETIKKIGIF